MFLQRLSIYGPHYAGGHPRIGHRKHILGVCHHAMFPIFELHGSILISSACSRLFSYIGISSSLVDVKMHIPKDGFVKD